MQYTVKEFAEKNGIETAAANSVLNFYVGKGVATITGTRSPAGGKGRSSNVFDVADSVTIDNTIPVIAKPEKTPLVVPETVPEVAPVVA